MTTYVESDEEVVCGDPCTFTPIIKADGTALPLTGKTVKVTVRVSRFPDKIVDNTLENQTVTVGVQDGETSWVLDGDQSILLEPYAPRDPTQTTWGQLIYYVEDDDYHPQILRFPFRRAGA